MPSSAQRLLPLDFRPHNNRGLFADHFLKERIQELKEWQQATGVEEAFRQISQIYTDRAAGFSSQTNEAQTEHDLIQLLLNILWQERGEGDCYQVQVNIPNLNARRQPDYAFFRSASDRQAAQPRLGTIDYWRDVLCLGDAKKWTASLDKERGADENPTAQICNYLYRSRVRWGILTNGRTWRLYEREKSSAGGIYYEINLEELIQRGDPEAFKYFYLFFRRGAFLPPLPPLAGAVPRETGDGGSGVSFIEKVFQGSIDYATEVSDRLKESIYDALRLLMNGFFEHPSNGLDRQDPEVVKLVHENCLIVLYRLLFLLYAEDRGLLPRSAEPYASYSLYRLQKEINGHLRAGGAYPPTGRRFWGDLTNLFGLIDAGFPEGSIPAYNGGLFSTSRYPHIAHTPQGFPPPDASVEGPGVRAIRWEIGDHRLAEVIDMLAYQREKWNEAGTRDIDYNTLDVRHLGSIYEGLLELQPQVATEPMAETLEDGKPVFKPVSFLSADGEGRGGVRPIRGQPPRRVSAGEVYLVTNRGERKATGSYYTPKYIVSYIVENTIGPLADEASKKVAELRHEVDKEAKKLERKRKEWEKSSAQDAQSHIADLDKLIEDQKLSLLEPYLALKILDPAMGSGHFLVGAADFLSLAMSTDPNLLLPSPVDGRGAGGEGEDPQAFYKRLIVERCLYGVDLNPLAVELAKLSLWLHTVSKDKALSFLDHHLRCGNSLIGARVEEDLTKEPPQFNARGKRTNADSKQLVLGFTNTLTATHLHYFLDTFREIMETPSGDVAMERKKDELYRAMDRVRDKFRSVANCWLAPYFGDPATPEQYERAVNTLRGTEADWKALTQETWFDNAQKAANDKRFFHWELEFPEIFFDAHGLKPKEEQGFDAVIGNPPWGALLETNVLRFLDIRFFARGWNDTYAFFMQLSAVLCRSNGLSGLIVPSSWLTVGIYKAVRQFMLNEGRFKALCYLYRVFDDVNLDESLYIHKRSTKDAETTVCIAPPDLSPSKRLATLSQFGWSKMFAVPYTVWQSDSETRLDLLADPLSRSIVERVKSISVPLDELFEVGIGIQAYCQPKHTPEQIKNRVFHSKTKKNDTYLLCLSGNDVGRYEIDLDDKEYLSVGPWLYTVPDMKVFDNPRILAQQVIWKNLKTCLLRLPGVVHYNSIFHIWSPKSSCPLELALALLNSRLIAWLFPLLSNKTFGDKFPKLSHGDLCRLPIRRIEFTTPPDERAWLLEEGKRLYNETIAKIARR